jgi:hypothetical protein
MKLKIKTALSPVCITFLLPAALQPLLSATNKTMMNSIHPTNYTYNFCGDNCRFCGSRSVSLLAGLSGIT